LQARRFELRTRQRRLREGGLNPARVLADFLQTPLEVAQGRSPG